MTGNSIGNIYQKNSSAIDLLKKINTKLIGAAYQQIQVR